MITESKHITNCYRSISRFFDAFGLLYARKYIQNSLLAAGGNTIWKGKCPADLVHFYEQFQLLLEALAEIAACGCIRRNAVIERVDEKQLPGISNTHLFCTRFQEAESWHYLPRYLSAGEFFNPYKALKKAIQHIDDTEEVLHAILHQMKALQKQVRSWIH